jgi:redox-sensing transcriptional repressor
MLKMKKKISERTIERLSICRRYLKEIQAQGKSRVYSHELAKVVSGTAAQVRRDLMEVGCNGCSSKGYEVESLIIEIGDLLDCSEVENVALVGVGNLGRAVLGFFSGKKENFDIVAAFDSNPDKCGRIICGRRCYHMDDLQEVFQKNRISTAILAVPVEEAEKVAKTLVEAGVRAILNFAPTHLTVNNDVFIHTLDMTMELEKTIFFSRQNLNLKEG